MITTFNRRDCLYELTKELKRLYPCTIVVVDDASTESPNNEFIDIYYRFGKNNGKEGWGNVCAKLWRMSLRTKADYYIQMVDDALPNENFFTDSIRLFESIYDSSKIAMHLANNGREMNWTNFKRVDYSDELYLTNTTETSCIALPEFFNRAIRVKGSRWDKNPNLGSGVFGLLCNKWHSNKRTIYGVKKSLLRQNPNADISQMNLEERKKNKWKIL